MYLTFKHDFVLFHFRYRISRAQNSAQHSYATNPGGSLFSESVSSGNVIDKDTELGKMIGNSNDGLNVTFSHLMNGDK